MKIDLNCDLGEGFGPHGGEHDAEVMPLVSSANLACGFHASDPSTMRRTVRLAARHGVAIGAHPSFPDLAGFGRRHLAATPDEVRDDVTYQVGALLAFCRAEGVALRHVKAHGALYHAAARDLSTALALAEAARGVDPGLWLVGPPGSATAEAARRTGLRFVGEAFADRAYLDDGQLVPRGRPGAVLTDPLEVAARVARLARERTLLAANGEVVALEAGTLCVHGDTPGAAGLLREVRAELERQGVEVRAFSEG